MTGTRWTDENFDVVAAGAQEQAGWGRRTDLDGCVRVPRYVIGAFGGPIHHVYAHAWEIPEGRVVYADYLQGVAFSYAIEVLEDDTAQRVLKPIPLEAQGRTALQRARGEG